jgi:hypothetical protein
VTAAGVPAEPAPVAHGGYGLPLGAPCPNCATPLQGPWCHGCGQKAEEFHRSIWRLVEEAFEGLFHYDSRFWNTLPRLAYRPGRLTRDYLDGKRASQVPPLRIFLVALVFVFLAGSLNIAANHQEFRLAAPDSPEVQKMLTPAQRAEVTRDFRNPGNDTWLRRRLVYALGHQEAFFTTVETWAHKLAIVLLPIAALLLSAIFAFRRGTYVFDHLIFAMHSLSFQGFLLTIVLLLGAIAAWPIWLLVVAPVHLFVHMRGTYRTGPVATLAAMAALAVGSALAFGVLVVGLVFLGLAAAH